MNKLHRYCITFKDGNNDVNNWLSEDECEMLQSLIKLKQDARASCISVSIITYSEIDRRKYEI